MARFVPVVDRASGDRYDTVMLSKDNGREGKERSPKHPFFFLSRRRRVALPNLRIASVLLTTCPSRSGPSST